MNIHPKIKSIIWDIDGTLLNTKEGIVNAYRFTLDLYKIPFDNRELENYIGPTPQTIFKEKFGLNDELVKACTKNFRDYYKTTQLSNAFPYQKIETVLKQTQKFDIRNFVVTNKQQDYADQILKIFQISDYFCMVYGTDTDSSNSKSQLLELCISENLLNTDYTRFIGDTIGDRQASVDNGIEFIGVNYGFGFKNVLGFADKPTDLLYKLEIID